MWQHLISSYPTVVAVQSLTECHELVRSWHDFCVRVETSLTATGSVLNISFPM